DSDLIAVSEIDRSASGRAGATVADVHRVGQVEVVAPAQGPGPGPAAGQVRHQPAGHAGQQRRNNAEGPVDITGGRELVGGEGHGFLLLAATRSGARSRPQSLRVAAYFRSPVSGT